MSLNTIQYVYIETAPHVTRYSPGAEYDVTEVEDEYAGLPQPFLDVLEATLLNIDNISCAYCGGATGYVLKENHEGFERLYWRVTTLARENDGPIHALCGDCSLPDLTLDHTRPANAKDEP